MNQQPNLVAVHLYGPLAEQFGDLHHFHIRSPREAIRALDANYPGFLAAFMEHPEYTIVVDDDWREGESAAVMPASKEIHIAPFVEGRVPVIALGLTTAFGLSATAATIVGSLLLMGLMIGVSLLFKPKQKKAEAEQKDENGVFSGPENTTGQGVAVPLIYGRVFAGSVVVSAGQYVADVYTTGPNKGATVPGYDTMLSASSNPVLPEPVARNAIAAMANSFASFDTLATDPVPDPWPDMVSAGAGVDHLLPPPTDTSLPPIVADPVYAWKPDGWVLTKVVWVAEEDSTSRKQVLVWQPNYETTGDVYNWNMVRGFYVTDTNMEPEDDEWIDGSLMETPIQNPAP